VAVGAAAMSLNILFSFAFLALFRRLGWLPHGGLALANSLATTLEMTGLLLLMRRKLGGLDGRYVWGGTLRALLAALVMGTALAGWLTLGETLPSWLSAGGGMLLGGGVYGLVVWALGVSEARTLLQAAWRRLR